VLVEFVFSVKQRLVISSPKNGYVLKKLGSTFWILVLQDKYSFACLLIIDVNFSGVKIYHKDIDATIINAKSFFMFFISYPP
jgi:hypothetical protein